jgi:hypothetical protein
MPPPLLLLQHMMYVAVMLSRVYSSHYTSFVRLLLPARRAACMRVVPRGMRALAGSFDPKPEHNKQGLTTRLALTSSVTLLQNVSPPCSITRQ